jgi:hypothetical protein
MDVVINQPATFKTVFIFVLLNFVAAGASGVEESIVEAAPRR